ncbi:putative membrane protein YgcG [Neisseria sp. HSC-16F19]|nr:hypothetical protein [Neisseria sp. HSC-16F19]MCP2041375.1 putative membrane protein YgcG [Neisseria sp. HSC-16F19]
MKGFYFWYAVAAIMVGTSFNYYLAGQGLSSDRSYSGGTSGGSGTSYRSGGGSHK